jgi:hypothetical protein
MLSLYIQIAVLLGLPAIYAGIGAVFAWPQLDRPWLFLISSALLLYVLYAVVFYFTAPSSGGYLVVPVDQSAPATQGHAVTSQSNRVVSSFIGEYLRPILSFTVVALPILWLIAKAFRR